MNRPDGNEVGAVPHPRGTRVIRQRCLLIVVASVATLGSVWAARNWGWFAAAPRLAPSCLVDAPAGGGSGIRYLNGGSFWLRHVGDGRGRMVLKHVQGKVLLDTAVQPDAGNQVSATPLNAEPPADSATLVFAFDPGANQLTVADEATWLQALGTTVGFLRLADDLRSAAARVGDFERWWGPEDDRGTLRYRGSRVRLRGPYARAIYGSPTGACVAAVSAATGGRPTLPFDGGGPYWHPPYYCDIFRQVDGARGGPSFQLRDETRIDQCWWAEDDSLIVFAAGTGICVVPVATRNEADSAGGGK